MNIKFKKKLSAFLLTIIICLTQLSPISGVYANGNLNVDLTLNKTGNTVKSGESALFALDFKISGADETIREEIGENSKLTIYFPSDKNEYYTLGTSLEDLNIDGVTPTYDEVNGTLDYIFPEIKTGLSVRKYISLNTSNGITPNGTELAVKATYVYQNEVETIEDQDYTLVSSSINTTIQKEFVKIINTESAVASSIVSASINADREAVSTANTESTTDIVAARPGYEVIYRIRGFVPAPADQTPGSLYLQEGSKIIITDTLDSRLSYVASGSSLDADNDLAELPETRVDGQKVTWTFDVPTLEEQKSLNSNIFEKEMYVKVRVSDTITQDTTIPNQASIEATGLLEENSITKISNEVKVPILLPNEAIVDSGSIPIRVTYGPGYSSKEASIFNPNKGVDITGNVGFTDIYTVAAARDEYIVEEGANEIYPWNSASVVRNGYKKIVAYYTPSDNLNLRSLHVMLPYAFATATTYKELPINPSIVVDFTLEDGSTKQFTYDFSGDNKSFSPGQPPGKDLAFEALGLAREDKVKTFTITYEINENTSIDGRFSEQVTARYDIMPGTEVGSRLSQKVEYVVTLADGTVLRRGPQPEPDQYEGQTAERYDTLVELQQVSPKVEQIADFIVKSGNQVKEGKNRVSVMLSNYNSASALYDKPESVVILPLGVTISSDHEATDTFYLRSQRSYTHNETIPAGEIKVLSDDYKGTGHQAIIVKWNQEIILPGNRLIAEFDVEIDKNAPDSLTILGYGFAKTLTDQMLERKSTSPIIQETEDINGDGIVGKDIATSKNIYVKKTNRDLKVEKLVKGNLDTAFSKFAYAEPNSKIQYKIKITNTTGENIYKMGFMDVLPHVDDIDVLNNWSRGSAFTPTLDGAITLPTEWEDKVDVSYSIDTNPLRSDVIYNRVDYPDGAVEYTDPANAQPTTWLSEDEVTDWSTIRSFKIELKDGDIWIKGQDLELNFTMTTPKGTTEDYVLKKLVNKSNSELFPRESNEDKAAWNSFAITTNGLLPTEPERVGVVVINVAAPDIPDEPNDPTLPSDNTPNNPTVPSDNTPNNPTVPSNNTPNDPTVPNNIPNNPVDLGNNTNRLPKTGDIIFEGIHIHTIIGITLLLTLCLLYIFGKKESK